jgi:flagellar motor switch protein FliN/FliY
MTHFDEVLGSPEWAFAFAAALGQAFGDDRILTVGSASDDGSEVALTVADDQPNRTLMLRFATADGGRGSITLDAAAAFAEALERTSADEILLTACAAAFQAATRTIAEQAVVEVVADPAFELEAAGDDDPDDVERAVYPMLDGGNAVGTLTLRVRSSREAGAAPGAEPPNGLAALPAASYPGDRMGASYVLADVEMGVTAELGRCRMTMRELLSITPGAVIDLDRAAGAPVDVLVNGTLIARGEVVVVDEEFGIRISELVPQPAAPR